MMLWFWIGMVSWACANDIDKTMDISRYLQELQSQDISYERVLKDLDQLSFSKDLDMPSRQFLLEIQNEYGVALGEGPNTSIFGIDASKVINETGTQATVFYDRNDLIGRDEETTGFRIEQDLLRNAFGSNVRKQSKVLDLENQILYLQVVQAYEDYMEERLQEYLVLQRSYLALQAAKDVYAYSKKLEDNIQKRNENKIAYEVDVDRIVLQTLNAREFMINAQVQFDQSVESLAQIVGHPLAGLQEIQIWELNSIQVPDFVALVESTRTLETLRLREQALEDRELIQKRSLYPELDLILGFSRDEFTRFNVQADRNEFVVGFGLSMPLGDSQGKAQLKNIAYDTSVAQMDQKLTKRDLEIELMRLYKEIQNQQTMVDIAAKKWKLSERILNQEDVRYNRGQVSLEWLLDAQTVVAENQQQAIESKVLLTGLILEWLNLTDQLIQNFGKGVPAPEEM